MLMTSCQSPLMDDACRAIAGYVAARLGLPVRFIDELPWPERYRQLDAGAIDVAWICGAPYVRRVDAGADIELLAAPIWAGERYGDQPVYFSDVVVRRDSRFATFADLRGAVCAYNEPGSFSGYEAMRHHLAAQGLDGNFFAAWVESGAHSRSLELVCSGAADVAAIDSTVLEAASARRPQLQDALRVLAVLGPNPMPPWVVSRRVAPATRARLRELFTAMHADNAGRAILQAGGIARFVAVTDVDYGPTRWALEVAAGVKPCH